MTILVTGAGGQLGQEFQKLALEHPYDFVFRNRLTLDITASDLHFQIKLLSPGMVINCAAYTAVDRAEQETELAMQVNAAAVGVMGEICQTLDIPIIHFSSDYVYHNDMTRPLLETDPVTPKGVYAVSKLKGEQLLLEAHTYPLIFRVSWLYSTFGNNFPKTMLRLGSERTSLRIVNDQIGVPTYAHDLANAVLDIIKQYHSDQMLFKSTTGVYNFSNGGVTNWAEIAHRIMKKASLNCEIHAIPSVDYPTDAPRPEYSKLNLAKFKNIFQIPIPEWEERMDVCIDQLLDALVNEN